MCIGIVSTGIGNTGSVQRALIRLNLACCLVGNPEELSLVDGVILPGASAAGPAMDSLKAFGLADALQEYRKPFLGLCLGMQLLFEWSEEGDTECLGILKGSVQRLQSPIVPHMGWNRIRERNAKIETREEFYSISDFRFPISACAYFMHSYACYPTDPSIITQTATFCNQQICAAVQYRNFFGLQWHPEKSGTLGDQYLLSFASLCK